MVSDPRKVQGTADVPTRRREERIFTTEPVELMDLDKRWSAESTSTQNISSHGARVSTHRVWEPGSFLLIKSLRSNFWARARVVYWRSFSSSRFTIGLEFLTQEGNWPPSN
ncbi:MAG: hypothetical protein DMG31_03815 [Acidobacteria bacterium]|nr:MAG: hypothetical protein DMG31_03815 [Acidobacteriota bacterium]